MTTETLHRTTLDPPLRERGAAPCSAGADRRPALPELSAGPRRSGRTTSARPASGRSRSPTTWSSIGGLLDRATIAARPAGIWRYLELLPVDATAGARPRRSARPRSSPPTGSAPTLGIDRLWLKDDTRNPTLSFKDRAVAIAATPGRRVRARGPRLRLDRQPRRGDGRGGGGHRPARLRLHPGRPGAGQDRPRAGLRRDGRPDRRHVRRRQPAVPRGRRRARLGLRQRQPAAVSTPRAARPSPSRSPRRSAGACPTSSSRPIASGAMYTKLAKGFDELAAVGLIERTPVRFVGGQAAGCAPVATAFAAGTRRDRAGPRTRHDRALAGDRQPGRRPLFARARASDRRLDRGDPRRGHRRRHPSRRDPRGDLPGDGRRGHPRRRRGRPPDAASSGADDEVVALLTGNGLKTPDAIGSGRLGDGERPTSPSRGQPGLAPIIAAELQRVRSVARGDERRPDPARAAHVDRRPEAGRGRGRRPSAR